MSSIDFAVPEGYVAGDMRPLNLEEKTPFVNWKVAADAGSGAVRLTCEATRPAGSYKADEYSKFCEAMDRATAALAQNLVLHRSGN